MSNIVLLVVDTLRLKELEEEGRKVAPFLTEMMEKQTYIENYYSTGIWTPPAHASIFTGDLPSEHGTNTTNPFFESKNRLVDMLKTKGYQTKGISDNNWVSSFSGFDAGFDEFIDFNIKDKGGKIWKEVWEKDAQFSSRGGEVELVS